MISFAAKQINPQVIISKITGFYSNTDDFFHNLKFKFYSLTKATALILLKKEPAEPPV
jgi:hypothetical protein